MRILQVNTLNKSGGAAKVATDLFEAYRARGHQSWLAVGTKRSPDPDIFVIPQAAGSRGWARPWWRLHDVAKSHSGRASRATALVASPRKIVDDFWGVENFDFPGTRRLLGLTPKAPEVVHLHNLHGLYFDLRVLGPLSHAVPVVVTLHDSWLLTGHCAISFDCERWQRGCGCCPYLDVYPAVRRDSTDRNWIRKRRIYRDSSLFVAAPSRWLLERAETSILSEGLVDTRLIPNGVDLSIFHPADRAAARERVDLPQNQHILLFSGFFPASSPFKDFPMLRAAVKLLSNRVRARPVTVVVLGESRELQTLNGMTIRFRGYETDEARVASYYQAADIYVHPARVGAENHSLAILEALACGLPVVATDVGGIPEQVRSLYPASPRRAQSSALEGATGILTPPGDPSALADAIAGLIEDDSLRRACSSNAAADARSRFDLRRQVDAYLEWYSDIIGDRVQRSTA